MMRPRLVFALASVLLVVLAGCGDDDDPTTAASDTSAASSTTAAEAKATVELAMTSLGDVLADGQGRTLYLFTKDSEGKSACSGQCATTWPPLAAEGEPTAGKGVDQDDLGTITRDDGTKQVTYYGHPLYTYAGDSKPGDVNGQNVGGVWFAVAADGSHAGSKPAGSTSPGY
jgi:predicted lipoprotein with Yx(FWY)xxD motif